MKKILFMAIVSLLSFTVAAQSYKGSSAVQSYEEKLNDLYCTGLFHSTHGTILDIGAQNSVRTYFNILDWLEGRVAGVQVYTTWSGVRIPVIRGNVPGIYLDEIAISPGMLNMININDIAVVKIIKTPFLGGFNGSGGAIAIYTFGGEEEEEE
jgi:hypothetical protein